jgi:LacI family transcriptional regulator
MKKNFKVVLFIESSRASGRDLLRGVARYAHHHGPWSFYWEPGGMDTNRPDLKSLDADGIIFRDSSRLKAGVLRLGIPAVVVGHRQREVRGLINVVTDSSKVGGMAAEHLIHCGFRHFAFCGLSTTSLEQTPWSKNRYESFCRSIVAAGFATPPSLVLPSLESNWQKSRRQLADWLAKLPRPMGILACNDDCGAQVSEACKLAGLTIPDMAGVVGVDNDEVICGLSDPPMTSIALNFERAGYEAAQALETAMRKARTMPFTIKVTATHLITRRSTDVVAVDDPHVAKALSFIRNHSRVPFSVNEVARQSGISRRVLEGRFRRVIGSSILQHIRTVRTDEIARLLLETNWPVAKIADTLGYCDVQHFARYFQSGKKMTPLAFRKAHGRHPSIQG